MSVIEKGHHRVGRWSSRFAERILYVAVVLTIAGIAAGCASSESPVESLRENYRANSSEFEAIAALGATHGNLTVAPDYSSTPTGAVPAQIRDAYKGFLREVGAQEVQVWDGDIEVRMGSEGLAVSGVDWGYAHYGSPPSPVLPWSSASETDDEMSYFDLGEGWYVYVYRF
ncbi:MAG: hypothetical protein Q8S43_04750 [Actinomycetota bacterium]|nr:hypothetical protein [Actinomycetota bacterium]